MEVRKILEDLLRRYNLTDIHLPKNLLQNLPHLNPEVLNDQGLDKRVGFVLMTAYLLRERK